MVSEPSTLAVYMVSSSNSMPTSIIVPLIALQLSKDNIIT